jgi:hypothetical protein
MLCDARPHILSTGIYMDLNSLRIEHVILSQKQILGLTYELTAGLREPIFGLNKTIQFSLDTRGQEVNPKEPREMQMAACA